MKLLLFRDLDYLESTVTAVAGTKRDFFKKIYPVHKENNPPRALVSTTNIIRNRAVRDDVVKTVSGCTLKRVCSKFVEIMKATYVL